MDRFHLVAEQRHAPGAVLVVRRENLDRVAAHAERAAVEIAGRALVLQRHQVGDQLALVDALALLDRERHRRIGLDRADTVDARHRRDDDDVVALQQRARRGVAHAVDLLVDRGFLLDIGVGARDVGFRLVVVVIADEILDRVVGKEAPELAVELRRQRLVRREDEGRALRRLDHLRHGEGLARAGDAEQHLAAVVALDALDQIADRRRLVALRVEIGFDDELLAAFGFLRPRRAMRRPDLARAFLFGKFRAALAQQLLQRLHRGGDAERDRLRRRAMTLLAPRLGDVGNLVALFRHLADQRLGRIALVIAQRLAQLGIDVDRRARDVAALRRLVEVPAPWTCARDARRKSPRGDRTNCRAAAAGPCSLPSPLRGGVGGGGREARRRRRRLRDASRPPSLTLPHKGGGNRILGGGNRSFARSPAGFLARCRSANRRRRGRGRSRD